MVVRSPHYSREEVATRGHELYESQIRAQVESENHGKIVAIDLLTGDFEIAIDSLTAAKLLMVRHPDTQIFCIRIGHRAVHSFGFHRLTPSP